jgi:DNA polymerase-1
VPVYSNNDEVQAAPELPIAYDDVVIVNDVSKARAVADRLATASDRYHAVDTEVDGIDLSREGPVGNGIVTCFTVYSGPDFSYDGVTSGKALFVDTTVPDVLDQFRDFFASNTIKKVWHNYGFDRHVVENMQLQMSGFGGDTMHMARLYDSARLRTHGGDGYSLEALGRDLLSDGRAKVSMKTLFPEFFRKKRIEGEGSDKKSYLDVLKM